jgi:L-asparagine transporter-like permease
MSLQTLKHTFVNEILTWVVFLILTAVLVVLGVNVHSPTMSWILAAVWLALLVVVYRWKYKHL